MEGHFRPEFINRLDDIVEFAPLTRAQLGEIVDLQVARLAAWDRSGAGAAGGAVLRR